MGFNEYLKGELEYTGILVKELAQITGIPKQTLDKYLLSNGSMPPADNAVAIATALGVSVEYLVTGKKQQNEKSAKPFLSPEMRSIADHIEPLTREERKIVENVVKELVQLLGTPFVKTAEFTLLQRIFLQLFR
ncbi:transcriptional regulator [Spirochaetia bacterium]|nr:transcriptional regulator [Spirochaetia bacterium]